MRIRLLKLIDKICGGLFTSVFPRTPRSSFESPRSILIIRPGGIGDAVLLLPTVHALKIALPDAVIHILAEKRNCAVFSLSHVIDKMYCYDKPVDLIKTLQDNYDVVIDSEQYHRLSAVVARLTRASVLIGFATNERERLFTHPAPYSHADHELKSFTNLLLPLGIDVDSKDSTKFLAVSAQAAESTRILLGDLADKPFVVIFPGASIREKRWSIEKAQTLAQRIYKSGMPVVLLGGKECKNDVAKIFRGINGLDLTGKTSLMESAAILTKSALLVSGDSGLLHIAASLGVPTVSLFGSSNMKKWAPKGHNHITISKSLPCAPCSKYGYTPKCPINAKCMSDIMVDEVFDAVLRLLEKTGNLPQKGK
ncbi:MAG: glycosyltransferase family 9 protein [Geobacter sp.]|nr:glycosyltransferase family 9 protein [Geobacter sp.]